jgi:thiol-disulfide isomerase/thioredoxin
LSYGPGVRRLALLVTVGVLTAAAVALGARPLPNIHGVDPISGKEVSLADYAGRLVVVNVWGSWCSECQDEAPALKKFADTHPGVALIGVDIHDSPAGARRFYAKYDQDWPQIGDPSGRLAASIGAPGAPATLFLDRRHRVAAVVLGTGTLARFNEAFARAKRAS